MRVEPTKEHMACVIATALYTPKAEHLMSAENITVKRLMRRSASSLRHPYKSALAILAQATI